VRRQSILEEPGPVSTEGGTKAVVAALLANSAIAVAKFVAWGVTGSSAMLAEGVHSVADAGNQGLLLMGGRRSKQEASELHPFGYGRRRYVYAFIVAIVLFTLGGVFALYEGWHKISHPEPLVSPQWALGVLIFAIIAETLSFRTAIIESNKVRGRTPWGRFIRQAKSPELPVILLEDFGALFGLILALVGVSMATITGDGRWDGLGSIAIGVLLVIIAVFLAIEMSSLLLGESASPEQVAAIETAIQGTPEVERLIHLRTMHLGPEEVLVAAKVAVADTSSAATVSQAIDAAEAAIRAAVPLKCVIYLEPDIDRARAAQSAPDASA
jgi:cation diffusion facilitator family transporter